MGERIAVHVHGSDQVLVSGVSTLLRSRHEVVLADPAAAGHGGVVVVVGDTVNPGLLEQMRALRGPNLARTRILLVVASITDAELLCVVEAGAGGVVPRAEATPERLSGAVQQLAAAGGALSARLVGRLIDQVARLQHQALLPPGARPAGLSERQTEVLKLVAEGFEVRDIAQKLSYSERTVKKDVHDVLHRFHLRNRPHAVAFALREGLI